MLYDSRKTKLAYLKLLGYFGILLGLMSGFYHASGSLIGELFDFSAMFLFSTYFIVAAAARLYGWKNSKVLTVGAFLALATITILIIVPLIGPSLFASQIALAAYLEYRIWKQPGIAHPSFKNFVIAVVLLNVAFLIWNLDKSKIICDPDLHWISGHAVWHLITAVGAFFVYKFYAQFKHLDAYDFTRSN